MATGRPRRPVAAAAVAAGLLLAATADALDWRTPAREPAEAGAAVGAPDEYAWRLFVALNWPLGADGAVDPRRRLGADGPVAWESWAGANAVFLDHGADPGPWPDATRTALAPALRFESGSLKDRPNLRRVVAGRMEPVTDPLADASRLTEIRLNRASFEYIRAAGLYSVEGQARAYDGAVEVAFPAGAKQVKAKWRPVTAAERGRYHTLEVTMADGSRRLYGLTALHVASKDLPSWFWATFEHVDNATLPDGDGWRLPSRDTFACGAGHPDCNRAPAGIGLEGTVWQHYRLRGTMTGFVADGAPARLANSELEAGMQESASCATCHARAAVARVGGRLERLPIFQAGTDGVRDRRGFTGTPDPSWYAGPAGEPLFRPLDAVWSLSKARSAAGR
jgi:hypothetical protein